MTKIIEASTLDDALLSLSKQIAENESRGEKNIVFCEDRLTLLTERAVVAETGATFFTEVTTFARFLSDGRKVLSKYGSVMEMSALISEYGDELRCFSGGSAGAVYETVAQLSASRVTAEDLRAGAEETEGLLRFKLCDLALLLEKYNAFLRENGLTDENGYLALLPEKIERTVKDANVFFFAFPSFTAQAREGVRAAIENAKSVTGVFFTVGKKLHSSESVKAFRRVAEEYGDVRSLPAEACSLEGEALRLCEALYSPEKFSLSPVQTERVRFFSAEDEWEEAERVAALIKKHVGEGLRYRDIAVLVPKKECFPVVGKALSAYGIPYFADVKRKFSSHPFCAFVRSVLAAVARGALPADTDDVLSNVCFGNGDEYRNYLLKYGGYRGAVKREIKTGDACKGYDYAALCACRERAIKILSFLPRKGTGREYAEGIAALLEFIDWDEKKAAIEDSCTAEEARFLDIAPLSGVLNEITAVAGERVFEAGEFMQLFENGTDALEVSMIPQTSDAVFVGDATESRLVRMEVLFATGLTDGLPRISQDTAVISDGEIKKLSYLSVEIEPAVAEVNARARESLTLNLCAFRGALYLSYPKKSFGAETGKSEILEYAEKTFLPAPMPAVFPYDCAEYEPAALRLLALKDDFERGREDGASAFSSLFSALGRAEGEACVRALLESGQKPPVPAAAQLYFAGGTVSPTLLEGYFACPYAGFASRALKLREREERAVLDTDTGTFIHAVLERTAEQFNEFESEEACKAFALEEGKRLLSSRFSSLLDTRAGEYAAERIAKEGAEVAVAAYRQIALSAFRVQETEGKISLPALALEGKADRIDEAGDYVRVIDYKTGAIDDTATAYYTGRKLQLQLYLLAASQGKKAAGAFYFPAAESFTKEDEQKYRMRGFFSGEQDVVSRLDKTISEGEKSALFEGGLTGKFTDKGMSQEDFEDFLSYSALVGAKAEEEMKAGNIAPSPYDGACGYCKFKSLCAFTGEARKEKSVSCGEVSRLVKRERGEK